LSPESNNSGLIIAGFNPCAVDLIATRLIGFDYKKIMMLKYAIDNPELFKVCIDCISIRSNMNLTNIFDENNKIKYFDYKPHPGWAGHIEINSDFIS